MDTSEDTDLEAKSGDKKPDQESEKILVDVIEIDGNIYELPRAPARENPVYSV